MAASPPRLWRFSSAIDDLGQWHEVEVARALQRYLLVSRDFAGRPPRGDVGHLCVDRLELERHGRAWCRKARTTFFNDRGRTDEEQRQREGAGLVVVPSGSASEITADGLIDCVYSLPPQYRNRGSWLMSTATVGAVRKLQDAGGRGRPPGELR